MNPSDFISLAVKLSYSRQEAELRTAVSRAYYGAFHVAREALEDCGICFPGKELFGADIHRKVRFCCASAGDMDASMAANKLDILRGERNYADYNLRTKKFSYTKVKNVKAVVQRAIEIVDDLQRCRTGAAFDQFRSKVRAYARDVLRLPVRDE